jgi:hypothetical protein
VNITSIDDELEIEEDLDEQDPSTTPGPQERDPSAVLQDAALDSGGAGSSILPCQIPWTSHQPKFFCPKEFLW